MVMREGAGRRAGGGGGACIAAVPCARFSSAGMPSSERRCVSLPPSCSPLPPPHPPTSELEPVLSGNPPFRAVSHASARHPLPSYPTPPNLSLSWGLHE